MLTAAAVAGIAVTLAAAARADVKSRRSARAVELNAAAATIEAIDQRVNERLAQLEIASSFVEASYPLPHRQFAQFLANYNMSSNFTDLSLAILVIGARPEQLAAVTEQEARFYPEFTLKFLGEPPGGTHMILLRTPQAGGGEDYSLVGLDVSTVLPTLGLRNDDLIRREVWLYPMGAAREWVLAVSGQAEEEAIDDFVTADLLAIQRLNVAGTSDLLGWFIVPVRTADLLPVATDHDHDVEISLLDDTGAVSLSRMLHANHGDRPLSVIAERQLTPRGVPWQVTVYGDRAERPASLDRSVILEGLTISGGVVALVWVLLIVRARRRALLEALGETTREARTDYLTGVLNRSGIERAANSLLRQSRPVYLLMLDLNRFKLVNDTKGHDVGDELLVAVASRLRDVVADRGVIARLGGDEFVVASSRLVSVGDAIDLASRIHRDLDRPIQLNGGEHLLSVSIGIATAPGGSEMTAIDLLRDADVAMYVAKRRSAGSTAVFDQSMRDEALRILQVEQELRVALPNGEVVPYFQPIYSNDGRLFAFEALARWHHPTRGVLLPAEFLDIAAESGSLPELNRQILRRSCEIARGWNEQHGRPVRLLVNLAEDLLLAPAFLSDVKAILEQTGLAPSLLLFEISEDTALGRLSPDLRELRALSDLGVSLAIDDFGRGRSSLLALADLEMVSILKLDREFVAKLPYHGPTQTVFDAVRKVAHSFDMKLVGEGVENPEEARTLIGLGVDYLQGFFYGRPAPAYEATALINGFPALNPASSSA